MLNFSNQDLEAAASLVGAHILPTPQIAWPQISERVGTTVWVKHENHTPIGAFKVRGGITLMDWLRQTRPDVCGIITATRGNHGQSQAFAAGAAGLSSTVFIPRNNSAEKNAAMRAFGATIVEHGEDFDEARVEAERRAEDENLFFVPSFHKELVRGVATYAVELLTAVPDLDVIYVPIGCGSGICGTIAARNALGARARIVGVVAERAPGAKLSVEAGRVVETSSANTFADGLAVRVPVQEALEFYSAGVERVVAVDETAIADAMRLYFECTHNVAEGAGAAALAALMQERESVRGKKVAVVLSGGNVDTDVFAAVLNGRMPTE